LTFNFNIVFNPDEFRLAVIGLKNESLNINVVNIIAYDYVSHSGDSSGKDYNQNNINKIKSYNEM